MTYIYSFSKWELNDIHRIIWRRMFYQKKGGFFILLFYSLCEKFYSRT